ncbi:hypothetical protein [Desulfocurvus sp. DL9XJH121]
MAPAAIFSSFPMPSKAGDLLVERFALMREAGGTDEAALDLIQIVELGVGKVVERTQGRQLNSAQRRIVEAVRAGRSETLVREISADVQDKLKEREGGTLTAISCSHGVLPFPPDVFVPDENDAARRWAEFLDALEAKCLRVEDPQTRLRGRIPFRDGVWFGDLIFQAGAAAIVIPDIREVHGEFLLRGHTPATGHRMALRGSLYADTTQLRCETCIGSLTGRMRLYSGSERTAGDLVVGPRELKAWGATSGTPVHLNDRVLYRLHEQETPEGTVHALAECPGGRDMELKSMRWVWDGAHWSRFVRDLPPETAYNLLRKFRRICAVLGLGDDFIEEHREPERTVDVNTLRINTLLALGRGEHSARAARKVADKHRETIEQMQGRLARLRDLAVGEGPEYYRDMELVSADIAEILDELSDARLKRLKAAMTGHCPRIDRRSLKADSDYLRGLAAEGLDFGDVLGTTGRGLVFMNNLCVSRQVRALAAQTVGRVRRDLKRALAAKPGKDVLPNLLKFWGDRALAELHRSRKAKPEDMDALAASLKAMDERAPLDTLRDFRMHRYEEPGEELNTDRTLLSRCLSLSRGTLDEMFTRAEPGWGPEDGRILQTALMVNMQSFLADHVRARPLDLDVTLPSTLVESILDAVERYRAVIPHFNRCCAAEATAAAPAG